MCLELALLDLPEEGAGFAAADQEAISSPGTPQVSLLQRLFLSPVIIPKRDIDHLAFKVKICGTFMFKDINLEKYRVRRKGGEQYLYTMCLLFNLIKYME